MTFKFPISPDVPEPEISGIPIPSNYTFAKTGKSVLDVVLMCTKKRYDYLKSSGHETDNCAAAELTHMMAAIWEELMENGLTTYSEHKEFLQKALDAGVIVPNPDEG